MDVTGYLGDRFAIMSELCHEHDARIPHSACNLRSGQWKPMTPLGYMQGDDVTVRLRARESGGMATPVVPPPSRLIKIRHVAGHGAAIAVTPYLLIKILWTFGFFLPTGE